MDEEEVARERQRALEEEQHVAELIGKDRLYLPPNPKSFNR